MKIRRGDGWVVISHHGPFIRVEWSTRPWWWLQIHIENQPPNAYGPRKDA